jgi:4-amino-4-deoxy-L-arabinose transferase-like glycosyltransferase
MNSSTGMGNPKNDGRTCLIDCRIFPESWAEGIRRLTMAFVILGLAIRLVRYLINCPLWPDETFLAVNFLDGSFRDLIGTLNYHQVAPLFFVWLEQLVVNLLGFSELTLRLFPFLAGLASVVLFYRLARKLTGGSTRLLAVGCFAVSYYPIRHSAEVKPYSSDLLVDLIFLSLAVEWWLRPGNRRPLWLLTLFALPGIGLSFPAVFVAGAVSLGILYLVWKEKINQAWLPWAAYSLT